MDRCFVIQPFDGGKFDKRFDDVVKPAILEADLDPYRVDRDPNVSIPIDDIQTGIELSRVCLADITTDNPNVWFELGYAIASSREVVLICADERQSKFPFDVQHRSIIKYKSEAPRDFDQLSEAITTRLKAILQKDNQLQKLPRSASAVIVEGLEQHEIAALISVAQQLPDPADAVSTYMVRQDMERAGFNDLAATLGLQSLVTKGLLESAQEREYNGEVYTVYRVANSGIAWLHKNLQMLKLRHDPPPPRPMPPSDEIPF